MIPLLSSEDRGVESEPISGRGPRSPARGLAPPTPNLPRGPSEPRGLPQAPPRGQARRSLDGARLAVAAVAGRGRWGRGPRWSKGPERKAARRGPAGGRARRADSSGRRPFAWQPARRRRGAGSGCSLTAPRLPAAPPGRRLPPRAPSASPRGLGGEREAAAAEVVGGGGR